MYREVDTELWIASLPLGLALGYASLTGYPLPRSLPYALTLPLVLVLLVLYALGYLGGADAWLSLFLALALPVPPGSLLPTLYLAFLYSAPFAVAYYLWELYRFCGLSCVARLKARVRGADLAGELRWWLPRGVRLVGDPHEVVAAEALWDREVYASPLLPMITLVFLGLVVAVLVGDTPVRVIVEALQR